MINIMRMLHYEGKGDECLTCQYQTGRGFMGCSARNDNQCRRLENKMVEHRYFTNVRGFLDSTAFVSTNYWGIGYIHSIDKPAYYSVDYNLDRALSLVKEGVWKEITKEDAFAMLSSKGE